MWLNRLNTRTASKVGSALAEPFVAAATAPPVERGKTKPWERGNVLNEFLARVDAEARPLQLGLFRRAKLANSFKWRLLESGVEPAAADELTRMLLLRLSADRAVPAPVNSLNVATRSQPESNSIPNLLARIDACVARGDHAEVINCSQELLKLKPRQVATRNNLGVALLKLGRFSEAAEQFRRATGIEPTYADAQFNLGTVLRSMGQVVESEMPLRRASQLKPTHTEFQASLGVTLVMLGRLPEARDCFERVLKTDPAHQGALPGLGKIAALEGHFDEAEAIFRRVLLVDPDSAAAWAALVDMRRMKSSDGAWLKRAEKIAASGIAPLEEADLRFAIGKYCDDTGDFDRAFRSFKRANELQKAAAGNYDRPARVQFVDDMVRTYTREALAAREGRRSESDKPIFVVGMMRSGTSLVEQIISSHPAARGAGELPFWSDAAAKHQAVVRSRLPGESLGKKLAATYLGILDAHSPHALRVVDKSTFNSDHLGLIHSVFPNARMIYLRRDPIDTCLSCYFNPFSTAHDFTFDLEDLAHYYREHRRLIDHWRAVLPAGTLLDVPYAELVADQEKWTRKIVDFLGLEWDDRCLEFHRTERPVLTASFWQVRQKIYKGSVGRWRHYEKFIGPLRDLKDLA
jgi:Flp pilus assembly protein TadD